MAKRRTGRYERTVAGGEQVLAFVPHALPPVDPPIVIEAGLADRVRAAEQALARLDLAGELVPSLDWFIYAFVRKEAVLSSQIEGTQATLLDLLNYEAGEDEGDVSGPDADVEEVCNYLDALSFARAQLADPAGLPLSVRLLNETHQLLLRGVRGHSKQPGAPRRVQNWVGGRRPGDAAFVPPPPNALPKLLSGFEDYIHAEDKLPPVVRAGLLHAQFETIHPYSDNVAAGGDWRLQASAAPRRDKLRLSSGRICRDLDGNGRIGRLLVTLLLEHWGLLSRPLLYLSLFFKRHRQEYYRRLNAVRVDGDWESWLDFFVEGVATIAGEAVVTARELFSLVTVDRQRVLDHSGVNLLAVQLFERLPKKPMITAAWVVDALSTSKPTARRAIEALEGAGVLVETTGKKRDRVYAYQGYLDRLRAGTELGDEGGA